MIQPFHADLLTGAVAHRFLDEIAWLIREQTVDPDQKLILRLVPELRLTIDRPAEQPGRILDGHDTAGHDFSRERIALADFLDIRYDALVEGIDRCTHPVGLFRVIAELVRVAEGRILRRDLTPHIPAASLFDLLVESRRFVLAADRRVFHAAAVGDEDQIVFRQIDVIVPAVHLHVDAYGLFLLLAAFKFHIDHLDAVVELHAEALEILYHRQDHRFILIVLCETQRREIRQSADMVDITLDVDLHLQRAVPVFECEHCPPVQPEVGVQHLLIENIGDALIFQFFVRCEEQFHDLHRSLIGDRELAVRVRVFSAVDRRPAQRKVRVLLVQPVIFIQHRNALGLNGRDRAEQIPHALEVIVHFPAAPHHIADIFIFIAVTGSARDRIFLQNVHMLPFHLPVSDQKARCRKRRQAASDDIRRFPIYALRFARARECFIIAACIIHT